MDNHGTTHPQCSLHVAVLLMVVFLVPSLRYLQLHRRKARRGGPKLPPGPWRLPFIGSLHHLLLTKNPRLVHRTLTDLARRRDSPVMYLRLGELPVVVVSSPPAAEEVMRTHDTTFASRALSLTMRTAIGDRQVWLSFLPYGERWRHLRKVCTVELLSARRVLSFRPIREDEAARLVAAVAASHPGEEVNVSRRIADYIADSSARAVLGERFGGRDELVELLDKMVKRMSGFSAGDLFPSSRLACTVDGTVREVAALRKRIFELIDSAIDQYHERRRKVAAGSDACRGGSECLLDALLRLQVEGDSGSALPMATIRAVITEMFSAGKDTTSTVIQWGMSELVRNPNVMHKAQSEIRHALQGRSRVTEEDLINLKYLKQVVKETLRLHPAAPLLVPRECQESCRILGYDMPKGTTVIVNVWATGRDPRYWDDADEFKPERFGETAIDFKGTNFEFIPFGAGRRMCPGIAFAYANIELSLAVLLYHFDWQLPPGVALDGMDMTEELGVTVARKRDLYLCPIVRVPL